MTCGFCFFAVYARATDRLDFPAFYCAGEALDRHANPYLEMPLAACEQRVSTNALFRKHVVVPAPLPPYALAAYAVVALLPYETSYRVDIMASILALAASARLLAGVTGVPVLALFATAFMISSASILNGQPIAFLLLALAAAGWSLQRGSDRGAACAAIATLVEPHVGLGICLALFFARPATRPVFIAGAVMMTTVSIAVLAPKAISEYIYAVLPAHAASEATLISQFSLTGLLVALGVPTRLALETASLQYVIMLILGVVYGRRAARYDRALLAYVPALFAVIGGPFLHLTQVALALPAAALLARKIKSSTSAAFALTALFVDWTGWSADWGNVLLMTVGTFTLVLLIGGRRRHALGSAVVVAMASASWTHTVTPSLASVRLFPIDPNALAEVSWAAFIDTVRTSRGTMLLNTITKLPNWTTLMLFAVLAIEVGRTTGMGSTSAGRITPDAV